MESKEFEKGYRAGLRAAWSSIQEAISKGKLRGDGTDQTAERNGKILAANIVMELRKERAADSE